VKIIKEITKLKEIIWAIQYPVMPKHVTCAI
jgi:hypothetical protein